MKREISGLYLVVDPKMGMEYLESRVSAIVKGGISVIQVWDHWDENQDKIAFITKLRSLAGDVPVIINNDLGLALATNTDGVHFDQLDQVPDAIPEQLMIGVTLSDRVDWESLNRRPVDYISFCSMFPSSSTDTCDLVDFQVVREAKEKFHGSVFASGGISLDNADQILDLGVSGIALISGLLKAKDPEKTTKAFVDKLIKK
ncbi:MAG: thiamine phosphate synthase [Cyclobacteriaceae bacterium]